VINIYKDAKPDSIEELQLLTAAPFKHYLWVKTKYILSVIS